MGQHFSSSGKQGSRDRARAYTVSLTNERHFLSPDAVEASIFAESGVQSPVEHMDHLLERTNCLESDLEAIITHHDFIQLSKSQHSGEPFLF